LLLNTASPASGATQTEGTAGDYHITALQNASNWGQVQEKQAAVMLDRLGWRIQAGVQAG